MLRRVPPVHSPISARALWRGLKAALSRAEADRARAELDAWVRRTYEPTEWLWTDSGTSALMLALRLAKASGRRRVALPAYGCYDLATACDGAGVEVALYDLDPATLGPDWASLEGVLEAGADIVVVAYLYGIPVDLDRLHGLNARFGTLFIEDAAQGVGASWGGRPLGAHGDLAVLSFGRGKGLTAGGGGLLMAHASLPHRIEVLPTLGGGGRGLVGFLKSLVQWVFARPSWYWIPAGIPFLGLGETVYRVTVEPRGLSRSGHGILAETVALAGDEARARRARGNWWRDRLRGSSFETPHAGAAACSGDLRLPVLPGNGTHGAVHDTGAAGLGVARGYPLPLNRLEGFGPRWTPGNSHFPGASRLAAELITLPTHSLLSADDVRRLGDWLGKSGPSTAADPDGSP